MINLIFTLTKRPKNDWDPDVLPTPTLGTVQQLTETPVKEIEVRPIGFIHWKDKKK